MGAEKTFPYHSRWRQDRGDAVKNLVLVNPLSQNPPRDLRNPSKFTVLLILAGLGTA